MSMRSDQFDYMDLGDFEELLADKPRDEKWELIDGRVVRMMVGARWEHGRIVQNIGFELRRRLDDRGSDCRVFTETFFVKSQAAQSATLPDVIVRCGPLPPAATSLDDPVVLVEVVSDGSAARDRVEKWRAYQRLVSLRHYVLIERDRAVIETFDRDGDVWSKHRLIEGLGAALDLPALALSVPLSAIYRDVLPA